MRLVFDIQSLQSDSRLRGIGRYTRSVIAELAAANPHLEIVLLLNGSYGDDSQALMEELASIRDAVNKGTPNKSPSDESNLPLANKGAPDKGAFANGATGWRNHGYHRHQRRRPGVRAVLPTNTHRRF